MKNIKKEDKETSCCSLSLCCCGKTEEKTKKSVCPYCGQKATQVPQSAARGILKKHISLPKSDNFWLCSNPSCEVSYFTKEKLWKVSDCAIPLDFKEGAKKRYACYCSKLTYEEVAEAIKKTGNASWANVIKTAGKKARCECYKKNPFGVCCTSNSFASAVAEAGYKRKVEGCY